MRLLKLAYSEGLEVFLYNGKLNAWRRDGTLTNGDKRFLTKHKDDLISEIKGPSSSIRINGEDFYGRGLMEDAAVRSKKTIYHSASLRQIK